MIILCLLTRFGKWINGGWREWSPSKPQTRNEAPKMRRIRNQQVRSNNPGLMFAQGVETIVRDHLHHPGKYEAQQASAKQPVAKQQEPRGYRKGRR